MLDWFIRLVDTTPDWLLVLLLVGLFFFVLFLCWACWNMDIGNWG